MAGPSARVRIIVADDHPLYRDGLVRAITERPEFELVGQAKDGREALNLIRELTPDVAVCDMRMPELEGIDIVNAVVRDAIPTRVLMLSAVADSAVVFATISAGAAGFWSKHAERDVLCNVIAKVARGESVLDPSLQGGVFSELQSRGVDSSRPVLSDRESEILRMIATGLSAPAISEKLFLSTATVKTHMAHLYEKLGVSDRAAAVAEAMRRKLLE